jgi:hypothetical protein
VREFGKGTPAETEQHRLDLERHLRRHEAAALSTPQQTRNDVLEKYRREGELGDKPESKEVKDYTCGNKAHDDQAYVTATYEDFICTIKIRVTAKRSSKKLRKDFDKESQHWRENSGVY